MADLPVLSFDGPPSLFLLGILVGRAGSVFMYSALRIPL